VIWKRHDGILVIQNSDPPPISLHNGYKMSIDKESLIVTTFNNFNAFLFGRIKLIFINLVNYSYNSYRFTHPLVFAMYYFCSPMKHNRLCFFRTEKVESDL